MEKLTVLIFSKDDNRQALELVRNVYDIADEIVLMDGSGAQQRSFMLANKKRLELDKLKIYNVIALGYREPLMMYALKKCSNRWVLYFDTDERPSRQLKRDVGKLINDRRYDAYAIAVYSIRSLTDQNFVSWQFMLFRKDRIEFRGLLHERAVCHGRFATLDRGQYRINQMVTDMVHSADGRYAEMERFQRYTYAQYNMIMLDQVNRVRVLDQKVNSLTTGKAMLLALLNVYEALGLKRQDHEVSNFDYWSLWLMRAIAHQTRRGSFSGVLKAVHDSFDYLDKIRDWRTGPYAEEDFEIAKRLSRVGVTRFLDIDDERVVERLNKKFMDKKQGIELLIRLIREKYGKGKPS